MASSSSFISGLNSKAPASSFRHLINEDWPSIAVVAAGVRWLRKRWNKDKTKSPRPRPRQLRVYGQEARRPIQIDTDLPDREPKVLLDGTDRHHHDRNEFLNTSGRHANPVLVGLDLGGNAYNGHAV